MENPNTRLEAFCDGVFAIALTLLIIEVRISPLKNIQTNKDLWDAIKDIAPSISAFLLSFIIIFISWVNHHAVMRMVHKASASFLYANGFLLLTIVIIPFPTALLGEHLFTKHSVPAVVLYSFTQTIGALGWTLVARTAIKHNLERDKHALLKLKSTVVKSGGAIIFYSACAVAAFWFPTAIAVIITISWLVWLFYGLNMKGLTMAKNISQH